MDAMPNGKQMKPVRTGGRYRNTLEEVRNSTAAASFLKPGLSPFAFAIVMRRPPLRARAPQAWLCYEVRYSTRQD